MSDHFVSVSFVLTQVEVHRKIKRQWWPAKPLISGRSGTHYVAMVKMLISSHCDAHLVESFCKKSNISEMSLFEMA